MEAGPTTGRRSGGATFAIPGGASLGPVRPPPAKRLAYAVLDAANRLVPKVPDRVVLHSTVDLEDGVLAVVEELTARGWGATVLLEDQARAARVAAAVPGSRVRTVRKRSLRGLLQFLTARYVMTTENVYGSPAPQPGQDIVNIWHGEPPTKVTGRFQPGRGGLRCTWAPVCSTVGRAYRAAEFGLSPLQVPIVGAPRNDRMLRADRAAVRAALLGDDAHRPTLLWLPSFRTGQFGGGRRQDAVPSWPGVPYSPDDLLLLDEALTRHGARVVVKLHPHDVAAFSGGYRSITVLRQEEMEARGLTVYPVLAAFDGLITDMSSVWVDYLLVDRPMIFAFPDVGNYRHGRGLNLEPYEEWVPGPFVRGVDELVAAVMDVVAGRDPMAEERRRSRVRLHQYRDDGSAARLLDGLGVPRPAGTPDAISAPGR